jgi:hypothetical protein
VIRNLVIIAEDKEPDIVLDAQEITHLLIQQEEEAIAG